MNRLKLKTDDPSAVLRQILEEYRSPRIPGLPPFTGGLTGYFSYDYLNYSEPSVRRETEDTEHFQDVDLMLFDKVIAFDNFRQKIILIVNVRLEEGDAGYHRAEMELAELRKLIEEGAEAKAGTFANMEIIMATTLVKISAFSTESHHASLKS